MGASAYQTPAQQREMREQRKDKFLTEFNSSPKYKFLRDKLKKSILRLAVEKHQKTVISASGQTAAQRDQFKADLYCFLVEQMKAALDQIFKHHSKSLHSDITIMRE